MDDYAGAFVQKIGCSVANAGWRVISPLLCLIRSGRRFPLLITTVFLLISNSAVSQEPLQEPQLFLKKHLAFSHDEFLQVERGAVVVKILKPEKNEVAAAAVVRVNVPQQFFIARFRDIERHKKGEAVLQVRKFSDPAQPDDLRGLRLLAQEVDDLRNCRPGQCNLKLSSQEIESIYQKVNWAAPDAAEQATAAMREELVDYVHSYVAAGNKAMLTYNDKKEPLETATQFSQVVDRSPYLLEYAPEFREYLLDFPDAASADAENFIYWSRENYSHHLKSVIAITHVTIYPRSEQASPAVLIASQQIYASHYFEASLGLTMLFRATQSGRTPSFYLVYLNRSRIDLLGKWYSGLARRALSESVRSSMLANTFETKRRIEAEYNAGQPPSAVTSARVHK